MEALDTMRLVPSFHESNSSAFISCDTCAELTPSIRAASAAVTAGGVAELAADGHGDNLATVLWLVSKVRRGKFNATHKVIVDHACKKISCAFDSVV